MVCGVFHVRYTEGAGAGAGAWFIVMNDKTYQILKFLYFILICNALYL